MSRYGYVEAQDSLCCAGSPIHYWWVNGPSLKDDDAIDEVLAEIEELLSEWEWNEWQLDTELGVAEAVLRRAMQGQLAPIDEVQFLQRSRPHRLFEIRLSVDAPNIKKVMGKVVDHRVEEVLIRIYHAEESNLPRDVLGVHLHRKEVVEGNDEATRDLQNQEIDLALGILDRGRDERWNLHD